MAKILAESPEPLYRQVASDLRASIEGAAYRAGSRIPTEPELSLLYGVSRITVRKAIGLLCDEGLLVKRQGKGTFVRDCRPIQTLRDEFREEVVGFSDACRKNGMVPGAKLLRRERVFASEDEKLFFGAAADGGLLAIDRVRTADEEPIMVEFNLFPLNGFEFLETEKLEGVSLFELIEKKTGKHVRRNKDQTLNIFLADEMLAEILSVPVGEPLFKLVGRYDDEDGNPLYYGRQYIIGVRYTFSM